MFRPVGSQPPSVYWRRRLVFLASLLVLLVLIALTIKVLGSSDAGTPAGAGSGAPTSSAAARHSTSSTSPPRSTSGSRSGSSGAATTKSGSTSPARSSTASSAAPVTCTSSSLRLTTATDKGSYPMGTKPQLSLLVTNKSSAPCVQNLGDKQIVMRVYNGESRVWGSHDCRIDPTPNERTLDAGSTVRLNIVWTGLSSQPNNCTVRPAAGAGTYTLYASLAGKEATASQFTITP